MSDAKLVTRTIDGMVFSIGMLTGRQTSRMGHRLSKNIFPAVGKILSGFVDQDSKDLLDFDVKKILASVGDALPRLFETLSEDEFMDIQDVFFAQVTMQGPGKETISVSQTYDAIFRGRMSTAMKLLLACIEVNYRDFWHGEGLEKAVEKVKQLRSKLSPRTSKSAGPSGASSPSA